MDGRTVNAWPSTGVPAARAPRRRARQRPDAVPAPVVDRAGDRFVHSVLTMLVGFAVVLGSGCQTESDHRGTFVEMGSYSVSGVQTEAELEGAIREYLGETHMQPDDVECFVRQVKNSPLWHPETLSFAMSSQDSQQFIDACGIDISTLWVFVGD